jgi:ligand-binding SRPBCC domain-containing protein
MYQLKAEQFIPASRDEVWEFISSPANLKRITPGYMGFDITSGDLPDKMYSGMIISYRVSPVAGIKTTWVTEITHIEEGKYFVDEQRVGPYAMWHHEHHLQEVDGGVMMRDIVSYRPPMGILGAVANRLFIRKKLKGIFDFRVRAIEEIFPGESSESAT